MQATTLFNTVAHGTTVFYYAHVLRHIAEIRVTGNDPTQLSFLDFRPKFFTIWGLVSQALLFLLCLLHDVTRVLPPSNPVRRVARSVRDLVLVAVAGPMAVTVSFLFWSMFWLDRKLVMPAELDELVPPWLNHAMHSFVLVLVVVQLLAESHRAPPLGAAMAVSTTFCLAYTYTLFNEYATTGRWIYPVLELLNWPGRVLMVLFTLVLMLGQVVLMRAALRARWGNPIAITKATKRRED